MSEAVAAYLRALRGADFEHAYHSLIEIGPAVLPALATAFHKEPDADVRAMLVRVAGQVRSSSAIGLLAEALAQDDEVVWKEALDSLVSIGGPDARAVVDRARAGATEPRSPWLDEASEQLKQRNERAAAERAMRARSSQTAEAASPDDHEWPPVARRIARARARAGLIEREAADRLGLAWPAYCDLERFDDEAFSVVSFKTLAALGRLVGVELRVLLLGADGEGAPSLSFREISQRLVQRLEQDG